MEVLVVCSGNTCRSPLAEALLTSALARAGVEGISVRSAGTAAVAGAPASEGSYLVALEHGLDLSAHQARPLTPEMVQRASLILTMGRSHRSRVEAMGGSGKVMLLGELAGRAPAEAEVPDPFGGPLDEYRDTFSALEAMIAAALPRILERRG